jgi:hypothetical protein
MKRYGICEQNKILAFHPFDPFHPLTVLLIPSIITVGAPGFTPGALTKKPLKYEGLSSLSLTDVD